MNVYILDWKGTLDQVSNPKAYVRALQSLGHKVVLYSACPPKEPVTQTVDLVAVKGEGLRKLVVECLDKWPEAVKVFISDDEWYVAEMVEDLRTDPDRALPVMFIEPKDLNKHLTGLASEKLSLS